MLKIVFIVSSLVGLFSGLGSIGGFYGFEFNLSRFSLDLIDFSYKLDFENVLFLASLEFCIFLIILSIFSSSLNGLIGFYLKGSGLSS